MQDKTETITDDLYPIALLIGYTLMPTGADRGVMAVCRRHEGEVSVLVVNSVSEPPGLADLALMAAEHEAEHHGGPSPVVASLSVADGERYPACPVCGSGEHAREDCPEYDEWLDPYERRHGRLT